MVNLQQLYSKLDIFSITNNNQLKNKEIQTNEFEKTSQNAIFENETSELKKSLRNKRKSSHSHDCRLNW